jgi:hypothetical protein
MGVSKGGTASLARDETGPRSEGRRDPILPTTFDALTAPSKAMFPVLYIAGENDSPIVHPDEVLRGQRGAVAHRR